MILCKYLGIFRLPVFETILLITGAILINLLFYLIFYFDINMHFKDKSLTMAQMTIAMIFIMTAIYYVDNARGSFLLLYIVSFSFGLFRLKIKQFLILACLVIASYATVIALSITYHPEITTLKIEMINLLVLSVVFIWFSFMGGYINQLREKVEDLATKDELTRVCNRRKLFEVLEREVDLAKRKSYQFGLLMIDLDDFKEINDTYGHLAGDLVLKNVASTIKKTLRNEDYLGRYGGEEFLIILTNPTLKNARLCANRIKKIIEDLNIEFNNQKIKVTISIGASIYCPDESLDTILARSDKALYIAKAKGKNTVVTLDPAKKEPEET